MEIKLEGIKNLVFSLPTQTRVPSENKAEEKDSERTEVVNTAELIREIEKFLEDVNRNTSLRMHYDKEIGRVIVSIIDCGTQKVIRQIPPEEFVNLIRKFRECLTLIFERRI
ncbi:MAG: flagellar protein FlaG [Nitrososphaerales archaeon]